MVPHTTPPTATASIVVMPQTEASVERSDAFQKWKIDNVVPDSSPDSKAGSSEGGQSAPEVPPKSPLRVSKNREHEKVADAIEISGPIPENIVFRTQGRVKRFTAELEEKKPLFLKQYDWVGPMDEDNELAVNTATHLS